MQNKENNTPTVADKLDKIEISEIVTQESMSDQCTQLVNAAAVKGHHELMKTMDITFDPTEDVEKIDATLNLALGKLAELSTRSLTKSLTKEVMTPKGIEVVNLTDLELVQTEKALAQTIKEYSKIIQDCLKEKRNLACQMYGTQAVAASYATRTSQQRSIKGSGKSIENMGSGLLGTAASDIKRVEKG